jgi:hypothetical protein
MQLLGTSQEAVKNGLFLSIWPSHIVLHEVVPILNQSQLRYTRPIIGNWTIEIPG